MGKIDTKDLLKIGIVVFVGIPAAVWAVTTASALVVNTIDWAVKQVRFNKKVKQGLKEGTIVKMNGRYYEVNLPK